MGKARNVKIWTVRKNLILSPRPHPHSFLEALVKHVGPTCLRVITVPLKVDRIWLWEDCNKISIYPIVYLLEGDYEGGHQKSPP